MLLKGEIDVKVAVRAIADTQDNTEVMSILSQSDTVRDWRQSVPTERSWDDYLKQAREYVSMIQTQANKRLRTKSLETVLLLLLSIVSFYFLTSFIVL